MRKYRNLSRLFVLFGMVALIYFNLYEKKAGQLGAELEIEQSSVLSIYDLFLNEENKPMLFQGEMEGGLYSFRFFFLTLTDPLAFVTASLSSLTIDSKLFWSMLIPLLLIILFGRFFCAWICPYSLFAEAGKGITKILHRFGIDYFRFDLSKSTPIMFLVISLILGVILSIPITTLLYPPRIITEAAYHLIVSGMITSGLIFLIFLWLGEVILSPHLFCRRLCPGGALFSILGKFRVWRVKRIAKACDNCTVCNPACPYDINPMNGEFPGACDNCGLCIDACKNNDRNALEYTFGFKRSAE